MASIIHRLYSNRNSQETDLYLKKIRIYVLTNKSLSKQFKNIKRETIHEIPVEFSIYDATKLYEMAKAGFEKEGLLRDYEIKNGKRISLFVYSLLLAKR